jgi:mRNA-degrading endonuclease RelE of RelBE toxin-antitoxin system
MGSSWKIELRAQAERELDSLPTKGMKAEAAQALRDLELDPFGPNTAPLEDHRMYRKMYLSRGYRIIYRVSEPHRQIYIVRIRPHDEAYSGFGD